MDVLALGAAASLMVTLLALAYAFMTGSAATAQIRGRLRGALSGGVTTVEAASAVDPLRQTRTAPSIYQSIISGAWLERMQTDLRLAESQLQPIDLIAIRIAFAGAAFVVPFLIVSSVGAVIPGLLLGAVSAVVGLQVPQIWLTQRRNARSRKLEGQLPDALTSIANALKAGFGLLQAMNMAADQLEHPIATELKVTVHETNVGSSVDEAFIALSERNESYDLDLVVTAVLVQRSAGGNLAEILQTVTETMRERTRIRGEINTLTAQQKLTGIVIGLLPVGVGAMFMVVSPAYITLLFTELLGQVMLAIAVILEVVGIMIIRRILDIEV